MSCRTGLIVCTAVPKPLFQFWKQHQLHRIWLLAQRNVHITTTVECDGEQGLSLP